MSFTNPERRVIRLYRSKLFVPGSRPQLFEKAAASAADAVCLDLEDAVAPGDKEKARANVIEALNEIDWGDKVLTIRINGLNTHYAYRDVIDVMERGGERLDVLMAPKVGVAADLYAIDMLVSQVEWAVGRKRRVGLEAIVETALGLENIQSIAAASPRLESLHFGSADYAASAGMRTTNIGGGNADYVMLTDPDAEGQRAEHWNDLWHYPIVRMVAAARACGLTPIDGPFGDYSDEEGFRNQARRTAVLGCEGKWAIHPKQVALCNEIYTPPPKEVERAERILAAMKEAETQGLGAAALDGVLIDAASVRQAEVIVRQMARIREKSA
jgi:malyl-CoA/(S)-citramalyl-CoA lyase